MDMNYVHAYIVHKRSPVLARRVTLSCVFSIEPNRDLTSLSAAARRLGISRHRLLRAMRNGELTAIRPGIRTLYVTWPEVRRWLLTLSVPASQHASETVSGGDGAWSAGTEFRDRKMRTSGLRNLAPARRGDGNAQE